jgi:hypothetical protein
MQALCFGKADPFQEIRQRQTFSVNVTAPLILNEKSTYARTVLPTPANIGLVLLWSSLDSSDARYYSRPPKHQTCFLIPIAQERKS